jgi:lipopolysaccharide/colanic/teichoic acid biosynthesis glycosyltransferase
MDNWNSAADEHHARMVQVEFEEARRQAREMLKDLIQVAVYGFGLICCCFTLAVIGAAILMPFIK